MDCSYQSSRYRINTVTTWLDADNPSYSYASTSHDINFLSYKPNIFALHH